MAVLIQGKQLAITCYDSQTAELRATPLHHYGNQEDLYEILQQAKLLHQPALIVTSTQVNEQTLNLLKEPLGNSLIFAESYLSAITTMNYRL